VPAGSESDVATNYVMDKEILPVQSVKEYRGVEV